MLSMCRACGHTTFPARRLCHRCGGAAWTAVAFAGGLIEAATIVHSRTGPVHLACVRTPSGARVIARLERATTPGALVDLREANGAVWASDQQERPCPPNPSA